jgi:hypothetical protein
MQQLTGTPIAAWPIVALMQQHLLDLSANLYLGFAETHHGNVVGGYHQVRLHPGPDQRYEGSTIYLCIWQLESLLTSNLTTSERLVQTFAVAKTVSSLLRLRDT